MYGLGTIAAKNSESRMQNGGSARSLSWEFLLLFLFFSLVSGLRYNVGVDYLSYLQFYGQLLQGDYHFNQIYELGFLKISEVLAALGVHFTLYFAFWAFWQVSFAYLSLKNERYLLPYFGLILVFGGSYLDWMNGIRQALAACIVVYSTEFILQRKPLRYFSLIILASLFHRSALVFVILYILPIRDYFRNRYITLLLLLLALIIGNDPRWLGSIRSFDKLLSIIGYGNYASNLELILETVPKQMGFGPRRIMSLLINVVMIWVSPRLKERYKTEKFLMIYNISIIGLLYYNLFANSGYLFLRFVYYFEIFQAVSIAYLLHYFRARHSYDAILAFFLIFALSVSNLPISLVADRGKGLQDYSNYKFFWQCK